jgi:hypothetical protein
MRLRLIAISPNVNYHAARAAAKHLRWVPHPFTQFVKGARVNHQNQLTHLHSPTNAKGAPGSAFWNLGLGFSFLPGCPTLGL